MGHVERAIQWQQDEYGGGTKRFFGMRSPPKMLAFNFLVWDDIAIPLMPLGVWI